MQQRFIQLTTETSVYQHTKPIEAYLASSQFNWLLNCEVDNVILEIKNNMLYFMSGIIYWGKTEWFIFNNGEFRSGIWTGGICIQGKISDHVKIINGVFKSGNFEGEWNQGLKIK